MEIKKIGTFHTITKDGYIQNCCKLPIQQSEYKLVVDEIINEYLHICKAEIHSIYIRGSVAKGIAIPFVSDIDILILFNCSYSENINRKKQISEKICAKYPYINGVEIIFITQDDLSNTKIQFLLKTQCACVHGIDITTKIRKFKIDKNAYAHTADFSNNIRDTIEELKTEEDYDEIKSICSWIMKRIIRTAYETVMKKDNSYTRDLYLNYEIFCKYHPNKENEMRKALTIAINPTNNKDDIIDTIHSLSGYILNEINNSDNQ